MDHIRQDIRYTLRQLVRRPGFTFIVVMTLALGIGVSTTMFSVVNGILLDPLPYPDSERLVYVGSTFSDPTPARITAPEFLVLHNQTHIFEKYAAIYSSTVDVLLGEQPEIFQTARVTEEYCEIFGVSPALGRIFSDEDFRPDASPVGLLSFRAWQQYWGGDSEVLGTVITTSGDPPTPYRQGMVSPTIIGVMPASMDDHSDLWIPLRLSESAFWAQDWQYQNVILTSVGRLRLENNLAEAQTEVAAVASRLASEYPQHYSGQYFEGRSLGMIGLLERTVGNFTARILLLFTGALFLLVIANINVSGLFLSRALERRREIAIRAAVGGGRSRIFQLLVTDTIILSFLGGCAGFALAVGCLEAFSYLAPANLPRLNNVSPDIRVVLFALIVALASGLIIGMVTLPSRADRTLTTFLRETVRTGYSRGTARLRGFLVTAQITLAVVLLIGAGLLSTSFARLRQADPGIEVEGLLVMPIRIPASYTTDEEQTAFLVDLVRRLDAIPGVESASWAPDPPMYGRNFITSIQTEETFDEERSLRIGTHPVGPDYFATMGIEILRGRGIRWEDNATSMATIVVDEVAAERLWPSQDPIGKRVFLSSQWRTIVGVVGRIRQQTLSDANEPELYVPAVQLPFYPPPVRIIIRCPAIPPEEVMAAMRAAVWEVDRTVPVPIIETMDDRISVHTQSPRFMAVLNLVFSFSALILTMVGIYGLISYWVRSRTREIGLRKALGARSNQVIWEIARHALLLFSMGLIAGLGCAAASSQLLDSLLFAVPARDLPTFGMAAGGIVAIALLACIIPAVRITRINPMATIREE
ncbi:ABC transporter permease [Gemmatimonadota bacterium]